MGGGGGEEEEEEEEEEGMNQDCNILYHSRNFHLLPLKTQPDIQ
jgi:hypothetical protein